MNPQDIRVLIACEESQAVCKAFRERGFSAWSCDIQDCSGGHPEWHIKNDVIPLLNGDCEFVTCDGKKHYINGKWNLIIAHPPCQFLTSAGNRSYSLRCNTYEKVQKRIKEREHAFQFFMMFVNADCENIVIENPVGYVNTHYRKPDQIIQPYYFGDPYSKRTCLWIKRVKPLIPSNMLPKPEPVYICQGPKSKGKKNNMV